MYPGPDSVVRCMRRDSDSHTNLKVLDCPLLVMVVMLRSPLNILWDCKERLFLSGTLVCALLQKHVRISANIRKICISKLTRIIGVMNSSKKPGISNKDGNMWSMKLIMRPLMWDPSWSYISSSVIYFKYRILQHIYLISHNHQFSIAKIVHGIIGMTVFQAEDLLDVWNFLVVHNLGVWRVAHVQHLSSEREYTIVISADDRKTTKDQVLCRVTFSQDQGALLVERFATCQIGIVQLWNVKPSRYLTVLEVANLEVPS